MWKKLGKLLTLNFPKGCWKIYKQFKDYKEVVYLKKNVKVSSYYLKCYKFFCANKGLIFKLTTLKFLKKVDSNTIGIFLT